MRTEVTSTFNDWALQLLLANLGPNLREEMMKNIPETLKYVVNINQPQEVNNVSQCARS
jgi:hypothetical protein